MHPFIPNTPDDKKKMLEALGVSSYRELLKDIPEDLFFKGDIELDKALSEEEVLNLLKEIAASNRVLKIFAGGGAYDHYVPQSVDYIVSRPEFYTAYTPYQAEVSQGTLQSIFEFQTLISNLTGLDVTNASMYDGASALGEALLMAIRIKRKNKVVISSAINPRYKEVIKTYLDGPKSEIVYVDYDNETGMTDINKIEQHLPDSSALLVQHPNYFGILEDMDRISNIAQNHDVILIEHYNPISLGLLKRPGDYKVDIATAEGQPLGLHLNFGGPYVGLFSARKEYIRQMPGRIIGETIDINGNKGYVMTLQTREQHIRRERATSNICSNQNLCALRVLVYLSIYGKEGLCSVAKISFAKAHYLLEKLENEKIGKRLFNGPFFNEFAFELNDIRAKDFIDKMVEYGILPGIDLGENRLLVAVTEKRSLKEIDEYVELAKCIVGRR